MEYLPYSFQLFNACRSGNKEELEVLLGKKALLETVGINHRDNHGHPALYTALKSKNPPDFELLDLLLDAGANPNIMVQIQRQDGSMIMRSIFQHLVYDCGDDQWDVVQLFLDYDADISVKDSEGKTSLGIAARQQKVEMIKTITDHGMNKTNLLTVDAYYQLCYHIADNDIRMINMVLEDEDCDSHLDFEDVEDINPIDLARFLGRHEALAILQQYVDFAPAAN